MAQILPPGLAGFAMAEQAGLQRAEQQQQGLARLLQMQQVQRQAAQDEQLMPLKVQQLQGALADQQGKIQRETEYRTGLASLINSGADQSTVARFAAQFSGPEKVMEGQQKALDRQAALDAAGIARGEKLTAAQESQTQRAADARDRQQAGFDQQRSMAQLAAGLRQPPQPRALQLTTDAQGNQLIVNPDGTTRPLTAPDGSGVMKPVAADKPMTEFQGKAALYGTRAAQSDKILKSLEESASATSVYTKQKFGVFGNAVMSADEQRITQAQRDFVNAVLRQESGAVISDAEFDNARRQYFPLPGDDKSTIDQKRSNRQLAIKGFARMSGPKGTEEISAIARNPLLPGGPSGASGGWDGSDRRKPAGSVVDFGSLK